MSDIPQVVFLTPDDSLAAAGDDLRDRRDTEWRPDRKDLA